MEKSERFASRAAGADEPAAAGIFDAAVAVDDATPAGDAGVSGVLLQAAVTAISATSKPGFSVHGALRATDVWILTELRRPVQGWR